MLGRILNTGYGDKDVADYGTGQDRVVPDEDVATMIDDATRFVARVTELLGDAPSPESR